MSADRWERLNLIFHAATALEPLQRSSYLDEACAGDGELREAAERLIAAHERAGTFIETPAIALHGIWPDESVDAVAPGRRFGPYRVLHEIARGGMGTVWLAERADGQYERRVALKLIKRGLDVEVMLRRFRAERQILASLEHPNIARMLDGGTSEDGQPFFAMEYIEGEPIDRYARERSLSITDRLRLFLPVCEAVAYAHAHGIIHRDIKPANILVTAAGVPKLLDFGIAKALTPDTAGATAALTGYRLLTPDYASPEQVEGHSATVASDVYSLGVVLYELLAGRSPYQPRSRDPFDVAEAVRTTAPERPSAATPPVIGRQLRGDLDTIVLAALRREPERRYPSAAALAADIRRHLDGLPIDARRDSIAYRAGKFVRRNRAAVLAATAGVITTALLAIAFVVMQPAATSPSLLETGAMAERDRIVVGRFTDQLGDTLLAAAIADAFRIDLAQSPYVRVLTPAQVRGALERMRLDGGLIPDDSVARELAVREGAKAFVSGSLARVGGAWTIAVQLIAAEDGEALAGVRETAADSTELIAAVGRASRAIRERLGETLRDLRRMPPLEKAATASLPALRKYTEGFRLTAGGDRTRGLPLLEEAVALDTGFAMAHFAMASAYAAMDEPGRARAAQQRAIGLADRLPVRDRALLLASDAYARGDHETAVREYDRMLERYPNDVAAVNNLALAHLSLRRFATAESLWHRALRIDSTIAVLHYGLHTALVHQGDRVRSRRTLDELRRRDPDNALLPAIEVQQAAAWQDWDAAERLARSNVERLQADTFQLVDLYEQLAGTVMTRGRLAEAERLWRTQITLSTKSGASSRRVFGALQLAYLKLHFLDQPAAARALVDSVLALQPIERMLPGDRPYDRLARFYASVGDLGRARALLAAAERDGRTTGLERPADLGWTRGAIALAAGQPDAAQRELRRAARSTWCHICPLPDLARAYEAAGDRDQALATYREYLRLPWLWRYETDAVEAGRALRRMGELHEARGEPREAASAYEQMVALWQRADGPLGQEAVEVTRRLAELRTQEPRAR